MAYELRALIAAKKNLDAVASKLSGARVAELAYGLGLLPLTAAIEAQLGQGNEAGPFEDIHVSAALSQWARETSKSGPIAYVEADYVPGRDFQAGVLWSDGRVSYGPLRDKTSWDPREPMMKERPINTILRALGVQAHDYGDEWDAVALSRHKTTDSWAA